MSEPYTPTTGEIREFIEAADRVASSYARGSAVEAFDRWLAERDRQVQAEALRAAADRMNVSTMDPWEWLRDAADRIEEGSGS